MQYDLFHRIGQPYFGRSHLLCCIDRTDVKVLLIKFWACGWKCEKQWDTLKKKDTVSTPQSFAPADQVMFHQRILMSRSCHRLQVNLSEAVGLLVFRVTGVNLLRSGLLSSWTSLCCLNTVKQVISVEVLGFYWCLKMLWICSCAAFPVTAYCTVGLGVGGAVGGGSCGQTCVTEVTAARRSFPPASDDKWPDQTKE